MQRDGVEATLQCAGKYAVELRAVMASHGGSIRLLPTDSGAAFELQFPAA